MKSWLKLFGLFVMGLVSIAYVMWHTLTYGENWLVLIVCDVGIFASIFLCGTYGRLWR